MLQCKVLIHYPLHTINHFIKSHFGESYIKLSKHKQINKQIDLYAKQSLEVGSVNDLL